jgi:ferredoxin
MKFCDQCGACAEVCPVEAIEESDGIYLIDAETCVGCLACIEACPKNVMMKHPGSEVPIKCTACGECAEVCPRDAIVKKQITIEA